MWLQSDFPWLASPRRLAVAGVLLLLLVLSAQQGVAWLSRPPAEVLSAEHRHLREGMAQVAECRGTESLLVMLPVGAERNATLGRLDRQQQELRAWLRDNAAWLAAAHGQQTVDALKVSVATWLNLQQRIAQSDAVMGRTGRANDSREVLTGPSADAHQALVVQLERLAARHER